MNYSLHFRKALLVGAVFLLSLSRGYAADLDMDRLEQIIANLSVEDLEVRYSARMDLQEWVTFSAGPNRESERMALEIALIEVLERPVSLEAQIWIVRQLAYLGTSPSTEALDRLLSSACPRLKSVVEETLQALVSVERDVSRLKSKLQETSTKEKMCLQLIQSDNNPAIRFEAFQELLNLNPVLGLKAFEGILKNTDKGDFSIIRLALTQENPAFREMTLSQLPELSPQVQMVIFGALASYGDRSVEGLILDLGNTENEPLKIEAILALGKLGGFDSLPFLLNAVADSSRDIRETALQSIALLDDGRVDTYLLDACRQETEEAEKILLMDAIIARNTPGGVQLLRGLIGDENSKTLRMAALEGFESIGEGEDFIPLVALIEQEENSSIQRLSQKVFKRLFARTKDADAAWKALGPALEKPASPELQVDYLMVIESAPTQEAIDYLLQIWDEGDPKLKKLVLRQFSIWPNLEAGSVLLGMADSEGATAADRMAAFEAVRRLIKADKDGVTLDDKFDFVEALLEQAGTLDDKIFLLESFRDFKPSNVKEFYEGFSEDPELGPIAGEILNNISSKASA